MLRKMAKITPWLRPLGEKHSRRMRGDNALSSSAALTFYKLVANSADNFSMKRRSGGRQFKSTLLHISVSRFPDISENRAKKSACARDSRSRADPESALFGANRQNRAKPIRVQFT